MAARQSRMALLLVLSSVLGLAGSAAAGPLEDALRSRWLGTWVVLGAEVGSDCGSLFTNNRVVAGRTVHKADHTLPAGELAKIVKLDVKRARVDVFVELDEPFRASRIDGPFELFDQLSCRVELQMETTRPVIKKQDQAAANEILGRLLERHDDRESASASPRWNRRRVEPLPADYDQTLSEYHHWRETQLLIELQTRLDQALDEADEIIARARRSEDYAHGLASGLGRRRSSSLGSDCEDLVDASIYTSSGNAPDEYHERDWQAGYRDGQRLAFSIALANRLEVCLR